MEAHVPIRSSAIDGLRTVAALSIVFLHVGFTSFAGGFVGVDMFFVISGYLITAKIRREIEKTGRFRFAAFYAGRLRRLYPALLVTVTASLAASYFLMSPDEVRALGASVLASLSWVSNFLFWQQGGYFDASSTSKPLLHTWSLSVEEQFYLFWPMCIVGAFVFRKQWVVVAAIVGILIVSLALNFQMADGATFLARRIAPLADRLQDGESLIYYLSPFRVFEFAIGALVVWVDKVRRPGAIDTLATLAGAVLIVWSMAAIRPGVVFPSYNALAPCIGVALVILGRSSWLSLVCLGNWLVAGVGRRTYSIYLVHWPIIVFYGYAAGTPSLIEQVVLCLVSIGSGFALYAAVEVPFYSGRLRVKATWKVFAAALGASVILAAPALSARQTGWAWRADPHNLELVATARLQIGARFDGMLAAECFSSGATGDYPKDFPADVCMNYQPGKNNVLLLGDSIGAYSFSGIRQDTSDDVNLMQNTMSGCRPLIGWGTKNCTVRNADLFEHVERYHFDTLLLSGYWEAGDLEDIESTVRFLADKGIKAIFIGPSLRFARRLPDIFGGAPSEALAITMARSNIVPGLFELDAAMRQIVTSHGLGYFSPLSVLCSERAESSCQIVIDGKYLVSFDTHHFMQTSAAYVFRGMSL